MIRRRSKRSSATPAAGPASTAGIARASISALTAKPEPVRSITSASTATLLKWSPISLTTWPSQDQR